MNSRLARVAGSLALALATARCADKIVAPVANAGTAVTVNMGSSVGLDGRASSDPQGRLLAYDWAITGRPLFSQTSLNDAHIATPSFVPDLDGTYTIDLVVSNGVLSSVKSQVTVTARKCSQAAPEITAAAAAPANPNTGNSVQLSATVHDADNDPACNLNQTFTLLWTVVARPSASTAVLSNPAATGPTFVPDQIGPYQFSVVATDSTGLKSAPKFLTVTTTSCGTHAPAVSVGSSPGNPVPGAAVVLTSTVTDADNAGTCNLGQTFTYAWSLTRPPGSAALLSNPAAASPSFTPDVAGTYRATLTVTDSAGLSSQAAVQDVVVPACGAAAVTFATPSITALFAETVPNVGAAVTLTAQPVDPGVACGVPSGAVKYVWTLASPSGSSAVVSAVSAATQFTFTPDVVGTYDVSVKAVDARGASASASTSVSTTTCGAAPIAVAVSPSANIVNSYQATTLTATVAPTGCPPRFAPQIAWAVSGVGAPAQLSSSFGGTVTFKSTGAGDYTVSAVAINTSGHEGPVGTATVHVNACGSQPPVVVSMSNSPTFPARRQTIALSATATDPDASCLGAARATTIAFELLSVPQGSGLSFAPGATSFQADVEGKYSFRVVATNAVTGLRSDAAVLNVTALDPDPAASSVVAVPTSGGGFVVADGVDSAAVTVTLRNRLGQPVAALPVSVAASGSANAFTPGASGSSDVNGVFTTALRSTKAESKTFTATANQPAAPVTLSSHPSVDFVAGPTASITLTGLPGTLTAGDFSTVTVTAVDAFANLAKGPNAYTGTVHFNSNDAGTIPANYTFLAGNGGTHTFTKGVRLITAGTSVLTATDTIKPALTASQSAVVSPAAPATVAFTTQPTSATAGIVISPAVQATVKDAFANLVPNTSVTVSIASGPLTATLGGTTTISTNASGVASFANLSITKSGTYTLHAAVTGTPGANSNLFDINPAAPATALFSVQPTSATAGVAISPAVAVTVKDAFANLVPGASVTVSLATNLTSTLLGTTTVATDASGVATFPNLSIQKAATGYKLHAAVTGTPGDNSSTFDITAAAPATAVFTVQPSTTIAGVLITPAVQVTVKDAFTNLVSGTSVTVSIGTNPGGGTLSGTKIQTSAAGVASFADLSIDKAGVGYKLHAAVTGTPGDDSTSFNINPAAPATAIFSAQPTITTTNLPIAAVQVTVKDAFSNLVPGASVTVTLGTNPTTATFSGTTTQSTNATGVASFPDLRISKPGTGYKLHAAVTGTPGNDSSAFDVVDPAVITTFIAAPTNIFSTGATQLSYVFTGGTGSINPGALPAAPSGAQVVANIAGATTFTLNVTNAAGTVTSRTATVTVTTPTAWVNLNNATGVNTRTAQPRALAFDPANPSTIYVATLSSGVLTTSTGAAPWVTTSFPAGVPAQSVTVGRSGGTLSVWASTDQAGQLYRSTNGGAWTLVTGNGLPAVAAVQRTAIRFDPSDPLQQTLYVTFSQGGLFRSIDGGTTWGKIVLPGATAPDDQPTALRVASNGTAFVGSAQGNIFRVSGSSATLLGAPDTGIQVNALATDPEGKTVIAGHSDGLVVFASGPAFGFTTGAHLTPGSVLGLAFAVDGTSSPAGVITGSVYAVTATSTASGGAVSRSIDFGATFNAVPAATPTIDASDYFCVAPHPQDGTTLYVLGPSSGIFKRTFAGP